MTALHLQSQRYSSEWSIEHEQHLISTHLISTHFMSTNFLSTYLISTHLISTHLTPTHLTSTQLKSVYLIITHINSLTHSLPPFPALPLHKQPQAQPPEVWERFHSSCLAPAPRHSVGPQSSLAAASWHTEPQYLLKQCKISESSLHMLVLNNHLL